MRQRTPNTVFMPAAGDTLNCSFVLLISFTHGTKTASKSAAVINTKRCGSFARDNLDYDDITIRKGKEKRDFKTTKSKRKRELYNSLPMDKEAFQELFDRLDENLGDDCDHTLSLTTEFL